MSPSDFVTWLRGFLEVQKPSQLKERHIKTIIEKMDTVVEPPKVTYPINPWLVQPTYIPLGPYYGDQVTCQSPTDAVK